MKTKIWKKICERVRIIENDDGYFVVQAREKRNFGSKFNDWHDLNEFGAYKHAIDKKHSFIVMIILRELGVRTTFIQRRTKRKRKKS